ncbi:hypothetical protein M409DRAFT_21049 [Zasmidium cellare ATCC 36951]|uniref:Tat pathway signal sequence n=1 Tax=Zasmidium cellare ATCC 36951 TaxID=1080233 RepID=A0A6A6CSA9_ZASCE|nr:uncharacterized protein M409DRAFT_21049 [Zasmidium cellare ATCC 36951]KAF2169040.1 hypothetical protein M409DRAFT_21049 [Zasmidium cellare ATCC 36951]
MASYEIIDDKSNESLVDDEWSHRPAKSKWTVKDVLWWLLAAGWLLVLPFIVIRSRSSQGFDNPMDAPIEYVKQTFSGIVTEEHTRPQDDPYGAMTEDYWNGLLDVGIVRMSETEAARLPSKAGPVFGEEEYYAGNIEVFHQLHCLNRLRRMYYFPEANDLNTSESIQAGHARHCWGYLEQTLRCHADVGVMSARYDPPSRKYDPTWSIVKTCRNFDLIHEWARGKNVAHKERLLPPDN